MKLTAKDKLWAGLVKERDAWTCQFPTCGVMYPEGQRQGINAHHLFGRSGRGKFMLANGIALCSGHHRYAHAHPLDFLDMIRDRMGHDEFDDLRRECRRLRKREPIVG